MISARVTTLGSLDASAVLVLVTWVVQGEERPAIFLSAINNRVILT